MEYSGNKKPRIFAGFRDERNGKNFGCGPSPKKDSPLDKDLKMTIFSINKRKN
jgi:hypothetical protein